MRRYPQSGTVGPSRYTADEYPSVPASRYHTSDRCPVSGSWIDWPCVEQLICTTSFARSERTLLPVAVGASRTATAQSPPLQVACTVKEAALAGVVGAIIVVTGAVDAVVVELSLLAVVDTLERDCVPSSRPTSATAPAAAATTRRTTTTAMTTMRFRDLRAAGLPWAPSAVVATAADSARVRSSRSLREVRELSTPNAAFSNDATQSLSSVRESCPESDSLPTPGNRTLPSRFSQVRGIPRSGSGSGSGDGECRTRGYLPNIASLLREHAGVRVMNPDASRSARSGRRSSRGHRLVTTAVYGPVSFTPARLRSAGSNGRPRRPAPGSIVWRYAYRSGHDERATATEG
jgi:hypothetical protein